MNASMSAPGQPLGGVPRRSGKATAAFACGLGAVFVFPFVCSILAIVLGRSAREEIRRDPALAGDGLAQAGIVLGILTLVLYSLLALFIVVVAVSG